ncbi:MAG: ATP-grasp domain-containing protein [Caldilineaceae bacterium]|nr:ATP-grasp domain-containing protein [Caldilineaceae bacterium]
MFKKVLIANRGEIAVQAIRTCRDMGIQTVALYSSTERDSLHVRLADECRPVLSEKRYADMDEVLQIARETGSDAIYPGYGFLAEEANFIQRCTHEGIVFIGPPAEVVRRCKDKLGMMEMVDNAGHLTPRRSLEPATAEEIDKLTAMGAEVGYPLTVKACRGGRGRGSRVVDRPEKLPDMAAIAEREAERIFGDGHLFLERVITPSHYVVVQILADKHGNIVHLGEREGSVLLHNQKLIEEAPAPCLNDEQRRRLWDAAVDIARRVEYQGAGGFEFLVDGEGKFYFTEIKARIQVEHAVSSMLSDVNIIKEQLCIAAGQPLAFRQDEIRLSGCAIQCRINAENPWQNFMPSPGILTTFRLPGGQHVNVDTYGYVGCTIPPRYDSLLATLVVWAEDRPAAVTRLLRALQDFKIIGVQTTLPMHLQIVTDPAFVTGGYDTNFMRRFRFDELHLDDRTRQDFAVAVAVAYADRTRAKEPAVPQRMLSGWHRSSRRLPS